MRVILLVRPRPGLIDDPQKLLRGFLVGQVSRTGDDRHLRPRMLRARRPADLDRDDMILAAPHVEGWNIEPAGQTR